MKKVKKTSKKFIAFLLVSTLIWLLITLSKEYVTTIKIPVSYVKLPQDKLLQKAPVKEIGIQVKATGFKIVRTNLIGKKILLNANNLAVKSSQIFYFLPNNQKKQIQKQLLSQIELQEVFPDTIHLDLGVLTSKKVPVKANLDIKYHIGYDIADAIKIVPDSIVISGPESQVKNIKFINLARLKLDDVKASFSEKVAIKKTGKSENLKINTNAVNISGTVEKFTEGSFNIPFQITNLPKNIQLNTLTKTVEVVFVTGLSSFNKIDKNSFEVTCDFSLSEKNNMSYLIPKVITKPSFIKSFRIIPGKIDFLIQK